MIVSQATPSQSMPVSLLVIMLFVPDQWMALSGGYQQNYQILSGFYISFVLIIVSKDFVK